MQDIKSYLTKEGWKRDLDETLSDFKDVSILAKRLLGLSEYGYKDGQQMTSREKKDFSRRTNSLWFNDEKDFQLYALTNKWPLGPCLIGSGKNERYFDDSFL